MTELSVSPPSERIAVDMVDPNGDIAKAGILRKEKSGNDRYAVLWSEPLSGPKSARLELHNDEKSFRKQKSPRRTILIIDIAAVYGSEGSVPGQHSFSIMLKSRERIIFLAISADEKEQWYTLLMEFVNKRPNAQRLGYDWQFHSAEVCPQELGQVIGLAVIKPIPCCFAFNSNEIAVLYPLRHKPRFTCLIPFLRSCGYNKNSFYIHCGRRSPCGEGRLYFQTPTEAEAARIKEVLFGEMCRGASSPPSHMAHSRSLSNGGLNYAQEPSLRRSPHSYTDGCPIPEQIHGHRPRAGAVSVAPARPYLRQMSDPQYGMRVISLQRSQTFHAEHHRSSVDSLSSDDFSTRSAQSPNPGRPRIMSGYEDMDGKNFHDRTYMDMSPRTSFDGTSRGTDYENVVPISRSYSSSSERSSHPPQLNGIDSRLSNLSLKTDEHSYQNIDVKRPGTKIIAVPQQHSTEAEYANWEVVSSAPSLPPRPGQTKPISMPPRRASQPHSADEHDSRSWHNPPYAMDRMSQQEEMFPFDDSPPRTTPSPLGKNHVQVPPRQAVTMQA